MGVQNSQKFRAGTKGAVPVPRVLWRGVYIYYRRNFGYGYGCLTELAVVRVRYESLTELPEVSGIVARAYRTYRSSGYGYGCPTGLQKVRVRVMPG